MAPFSETGTDERRQAETERRAKMLDRVLTPFGARYAAATLQSYEVTHGASQRRAVDRLTRYAEEIPARLADGQSIVLYGNSGTGKDHLLLGLARVAILDFGRTVVWRNGPAMGGEFRAAMRSGDESTLIDRLTDPQVLFISDPGARGREAMTDFMATSLFSVIDARYRARKPTWITLNTETPQEAEFRLGTPIVDRLRDRSLRVFCDWPSWRQRECGLFDE